MNSLSSMIEVADLTHSYGGKEILKGLNLSIARGEVFALIGPTGAVSYTHLTLPTILLV